MELVPVYNTGLQIHYVFYEKELIINLIGKDVKNLTKLRRENPIQSSIRSKGNL
jgi:hypothetical protein